MSEQEGPVRRVVAAGVALAALASCAVVLSLVPTYPLSLLEHFRVQLFAGSVVVAVIAAIARVALWLDVALVNALIAYALVAPALSGSPPAGAPGAVPLRVLLSNVLTSNRDDARLRALIAETEPDVIALLESNSQWCERLRPALGEYTGRVEVADAANFGVALYSKAPMRATVEHLGSRQATVVATLELPGAVPLSIVLTHPMPPISAKAERIHRRHLAAVADRANGLPRPLLLLGDLNTTPWASSFAQLVAATGLADTRRGFGLAATYPAMPPWMAFARIPIDHALISSELGVLDRRVERNLGSDHFPVLLDLTVPAR